MSSNASRQPAKRLRVGIVGAGEVSQVVHLPTLTYMSDRFEVLALCDVSREALQHVASKWKVPKTFTSSVEMAKEADIDVILIANSDEYHAECILEALEAGKHVFIEKPLCLCRSEAAKIIEAAKKAEENKGARLFVGYMRRYAPAFKTFRQLLKESGPIRHVVVKDLGGPNSFFVGQSATFPRKFVSDIPASASSDRSARAQAILDEALPSRQAASPRLSTAFRLLGSLGSHDLSMMREALGGLPDRCTSAFASNDGLFVSAQLEYDGKGLEDEKKGQEPFSVLFTIGIHKVGVFESALEVWTDERILRIDIDTPYVKGLPIPVIVKENDAEGRYVERTIRTSYQDAYTTEFEELYEALTDPKRPIKTTAEDAVKELDLFDMIMSKMGQQ